MDRDQQRIEAAFLAQCSPQAAYDWLFARRYTGDEGPPYRSETPKVLEYLLVRRKEPLIDLGIARFGHSNEAIRRVFRRGNLGVRCAALSNPSIGSSMGLGPLSDGWLDEKDSKELIRSGTKAELESLAKNKYLNNEALEELIEKKEAFSELSDNQYLHMLVCLGRNPRMSTEYNEKILDGWLEYRHDRVFSLAWDLALSLPATQRNAYVLYALLQHTMLPVNFKNPEEVIKRWRIKDEEKLWEPSYLLRSRLADLLEADEQLLASDDLAVRESFYRRFPPWKYKDWPTFIERDGKLAFEGMVENDKLWYDDEYRRLLRELAWEVPDTHYSLDAVNILNAVEERKRRQHPKWFPEKDSYNIAIPCLENKLDRIVDTTESLLENDDQVKKSQIEKVEHLLNSIENNINESQIELRQSLHRLQSEFDVLRENLIETAETEAVRHTTYCKYPGAGATMWPWIIVIALLILILLK